MKLDNFIFLAGNTARSKAYLQLLIKEKLHPSLCMIYVDDGKRFIEESADWKERNQYKYFDEKEPIIVTLKKNHLEYKIIEEKDINSDVIFQILQKTKQEYIIYSGYGGVILKERLFGIGKKFIHIHAGRLPQYRGSTTAYYSIIQERCISATAIFLSEKIDEGDIILSEDFDLPNDNVEIDYIYEPYIRAVVLVETIKKYYKDDKVFKTCEQATDNAETYFIIHPVLKHLALMSFRGN